MSITSLSFAFVQYTSTVAMAEPKAPTPAPAPAPKPVQEASCRHGECDGPSKSPLLRALKDALAEMARAARTSTSNTSSAPPTASSSTAAVEGSAPAQDIDAADASVAAKADNVDLERALMDFARALMQALRSAGRHGGHEDGGDHDHHGHLHHHNRHQWGDPAQRVEMLGRRFDSAQTAATAPAVSANTAGAAEPAAQAGATSSTEAGDVPVAVEAAPAALSGSQTTTVYAATVNIQRSDSPWRFGGVQQRLLDAFSGMQQAFGRPVDEDGDSLKEQLAAFLYALAQRLRGDDAVTADAAPGALLSTTA